jgi:hypothetical protein
MVVRRDGAGGVRRVGVGVVRSIRVGRGEGRLSALQRAGIPSLPRLVGVIDARPFAALCNFFLVLVLVRLLLLLFVCVRIIFVFGFTFVIALLALVLALATIFLLVFSDILLVVVVVLFAFLFCFGWWSSWAVMPTYVFGLTPLSVCSWRHDRRAWREAAHLLWQRRRSRA